MKTSPNNPKVFAAAKHNGSQVPPGTWQTQSVASEANQKASATASWLVTGGAGYIGAHVVRALLQQGCRVTVLDNLDSGIAARLPLPVEVHVGSVRDVARILNGVRAGTFQGVIHLAGYKNARESAQDPLRYWSNNVGEMIPLLEWVIDQRILNFVFSSSSSLYGNQAGAEEQSTIQPVSPYGNSKAAAEQLLMNVAEAFPINSCCLRYFNVIGCGPFSRSHDTGVDNVVPRFVAAAEAGERMQIYGARHGTPDGTCIRDYVDVRDLAAAHALVASRMVSREWVPPVINVSTGIPISVRDIALGVASASGLPGTPIDIRDAHPADPAEVWAHPSPTLKSWGWAPRYSLTDSIRDHVASVKEEIEGVRD